MEGASRSAVSATSSPGTLGTLRTEFGFKTEVSGAHTARTMMLADLTQQLIDLPDDLITKVNLLYDANAHEALLKAIVE